MWTTRNRKFLLLPMYTHARHIQMYVSIFMYPNVRYDRLTTCRSMHTSGGIKFIYSSFSCCPKMYAYAYHEASEEVKLENTTSEFLPSASPIRLASLEQQLIQLSE